MAYSNIQDSQHLTEKRKDKVSYANKLYCNLRHDKGIEICSWEGFSAWREYVDGNIDEMELNTRAEAEIMEYHGEFNDLRAVKKDSDITEPQKRRIKIANKIYRKICTNSGTSFCFFKNFASWSDYVNGLIPDDEFIEGARMEILKMQEEQKTVTYLPRWDA